MVELLERQIELLEEQNELTRENSQLLGDVLNSLDNIGNRPGVPTFAITADEKALASIELSNYVPNVAEKKKDRGPVPRPDAKLLDLATYGTTDVGHAELAQPLEVSHFWPTGKANPGWVRVSVKHGNKESLDVRIARGCLCGSVIVLKKHNGDAFYTCEALTQKGSCPYRPAAYYDKLTFLANLPPAK